LAQVDRRSKDVEIKPNLSLCSVYYYADGYNQLERPFT